MPGAAGYTGAGTRIAVIDTGIDTDHQSFAADAFAYSLSRQAELHEIPADEYTNRLICWVQRKLRKNWGC